MFPRSGLQAALERIAYQTDSQLSARLIDLNERTLKLVQDGVPVKVAVGQKYCDQLIDIVYKELGLRVAKVYISRGTLDGYVYPLFRNIDSSTYLEERDAFSGKLGTEFIDPIFKEVAPLFHESTARVDPAVNKFYQIVFGIGDMFFTEKTADGAPLFTSREITAITLHELGHAFSNGKLCANYYYKADAINDTITYLKSAPSMKIGVDRVNTIAQALNKHRSALNQQGVSIIDEITSQSIIGQESVVAPNVLASIFAPIISFVILFIVSVLFYIVNNAIAHAAYEDTSVKSSDSVSTTNAYMYTERIADEFVSRHGLADALVSALQKAENHNDPIIYEFNTLSTLLQLPSIVLDNTLSSMFGYDVKTYDPIITRFEKLLKDNYAIFKDPKLPPAVRDHYLDTIDRCEKLITTYKSASSVKIREFIRVVIFKCDSYKSFYGMLKNANLKSSYTFLENKIHDLIRNPFYAKAAELGRVIDKSSRV